MSRLQTLRVSFGHLHLFFLTELKFNESEYPQAFVLQFFNRGQIASQSSLNSSAMPVGVKKIFLKKKDAIKSLSPTGVGFAVARIREMMLVRTEATVFLCRFFGCRNMRHFGAEIRAQTARKTFTQTARETAPNLW